MIHRRLRPAHLAACLTALTLVISACGSAAAPASGQAGAARAAGGGTPGHVVVYSAGPANLAKLLAKDFEKKTGITVDMFQSTTGKVLGRLEAERNNPKADVVVLADWAAPISLVKQGLTHPFHPAGLSEVRWVGAGDNYFAYSASALGITYNTKLVSTPPADWSAAEAPRWKGKVVMPDPSLSGSAFDFVGGYLQNHANSWSLLQQLKANGMAVEGANAPALNEVVTGARDMVLAGVDYMAYQGKAKGEPLGIVYPSSGTVVNPRPVLILKSAPDLANAEKFVNFLLSKQGQADVAKEYLIPGMKDAPGNPGRAALSQIPQLKVSWSQLAAQKKSILQQFSATVQ